MAAHDRMVAHAHHTPQAVPRHSGRLTGAHRCQRAFTVRSPQPPDGVAPRYRYGRHVATLVYPGPPRNHTEVHSHGERGSRMTDQIAIVAEIRSGMKPALEKRLQD